MLTICPYCSNSMTVDDPLVSQVHCPYCSKLVGIGRTASVTQSSAPKPDKQLRRSVSSLMTVCVINLILTTVLVIYDAVSEYRYQQAISSITQAVEKMQRSLAP